MSIAAWLVDTWGMHGDVGWGWMVVMMLGMVLFWGAVLFGIVWLVRSVDRRGSIGAETAAGREAPLEILERRFAEGTISPEDYWARREILLDGRTDPAGARSEATLVPGG